MSKANRPDNFQYRVDSAVATISAGRPTSRSFDNCFENDDGEAVAVAVYRRARRNPKLRANLWRYIDRRLTVTQAWQARRKTRAELKTWAAELRTKAREAFAELMRKQDQERADKRARAVAAGYSHRPFEEYKFELVRPDGTAGTTFYHESDFGHWACRDMEAATAAA